MQNVMIADVPVGPGRPCFVIAEIGAMYEDLEGMKALIRLARKAGADAVKLQTYRAETLALPGAEFEFEDGSKMPQLEFFKRYEISPEHHRVLFDCAHEEGILIFSTPSHRDDVDLLVKLGVPCLKTGSDDLTNHPLLEYMARTGKPLLLSTGMSTLHEIEEALTVIRAAGNIQVVLLHCTVSYPPAPEFAHLHVIETLRRAFDVPVGYSDHTVGVFPPALAVSMGACVVEKHITLDRSLERPDSQVALEPHELKTMIEYIRSIPVLQGETVKRVTATEEKWRRNARKSLVAVRAMTAGELLTSQDVTIMRPGTGLHPRHLPLVLGRRLRKDVTAGEILSPDTI